MSENASAPPISPQHPTATGDDTIPAATVVVFRSAPDGGQPQLLMAQRGQAMRFAGGATVFPGGRVDQADWDLALGQTPHLAGDALADAAARIAGIRETLEETGLVIGVDMPVSGDEAMRARQLLLDHGALAPVLAQMGWRLVPDRLISFARWCPYRPKTFDTRFYLADLGSGQVDIAADGTEFTRMFWITAKQALAQETTGELSLIFPTRMNLERLALFASFDEARAHAQATPAGIITARIEEREDEPWLVIQDGLGYPVLGQPLAMAKRGLG